jgi:hypothetical protein
MSSAVECGPPGRPTGVVALAGDAAADGWLATADGDGEDGEDVVGWEVR